LKSLFVLVAFLFAGACLAADPAFVRAVDGLNLRSQAGTTGKIISLLPFGTAVAVLERANDLSEVGGLQGHWARVSCSAGKGWVFDYYLTDRLTAFDRLKYQAFLDYDARKEYDNLAYFEAGFQIVDHAGSLYLVSYWGHTPAGEPEYPTYFVVYAQKNTSFKQVLEQSDWACRQIVLADVNKDGVLDIVVWQNGCLHVSIALYLAGC
jgi:hypothetical protein